MNEVITFTVRTEDGNVLEFKSTVIPVIGNIVRHSETRRNYRIIDIVHVIATCRFNHIVLISVLQK